MKRFENEQRPPMPKAIKLKCKDCMAYYADGRNDCEVTGCPLYYWMPYRSKPADLWWAKKNISDIRAMKD